MEDNIYTITLLGEVKPGRHTMQADMNGTGIGEVEVTAHYMGPIDFTGMKIRKSFDSDEWITPPFIISAKNRARRRINRHKNREA